MEKIKRIKKICIGLCMCANISMLWGCASNNVHEKIENTEDKGEIENLEAVSLQKALTNYVTEELMECAILSESANNAAIANVMKKAAEGEKVTIACIGGSITEGTISNGSGDAEIQLKKRYIDIFFEWWKTTYPDTEFEFINAGIGATNSYIGAHRVKSDVLEHNVDLVLVEFSVNDGNSYNCKHSYDNLVRTILQSDNNPAVMLLFMSGTDGKTAKDTHILVGNAYELPMISYADAISAMMSEGIYTDTQLSGDIIHPSALGHAITGEILWKYLNSVYEVAKDYSAPEVFKKVALTDEAYLNSEILDSESIIPDSFGNFKKSSMHRVFTNNWTCEEGEGNLIFTVKCKNIGIMYLKTNDGNSGQFEVWVDGIYMKTLDGNFFNGWGSFADSQEVYTSEECEEHKIEIKKAANSTGDLFTVLGLMISY